MEKWERITKTFELICKEQWEEIKKVYGGCWGINESMQPNQVAMKINFNVKIESEHELDDLLNINGLTKYVNLNYARSDVEKRWPFLKKLWASGMSFYSYSVKKINDYFGREVLQKDTPTMSAYTINYLINLFNKEKYWDET
jgi:hypothetical protein